MALPKNRDAVQELLKELEPRILGREHKGFSCGCGGVQSGAAVAEAIHPAGDSYPGQETSWFIWSVKMKTHDEGPGWSCGLSHFIDAEELDAMFERHFGDQDKEKNPYRLKINGADRVHDGLLAAVRIQENDSQIRFSFSWGREQDTAEQLSELYRTSPRRLPGNSEEYIRVVALLEAIEPEVYRGGPDPELPYESTWHLDYRAVLLRAAVDADHVFFQNFGRTFDSRGEVETQADVVFMKYEVT